MITFPVMLLLEGRQAVVVGGGSVGRRKARALADAGARVRLVDPAAGSDAQGPWQVVPERYRPEHLVGATVVIACTDDRPLNARVADDARAAGALVNVADDPPLCDFYMPAVVRDGDVIVAIGTGGSCPGLAGMLRERLGPALPPRVGEFAAALADLRAENRDQVGNPERRMSLIKGLADQRGYEAFCRGGLDALRDMLLQPPQPDERPPAADTERAGAPGDGKLLNPPAEPPAAEPPARQ